MGLRLVASGLWASRSSCRRPLSRICALPLNSKVLPFGFNLGFDHFPNRSYPSHVMTAKFTFPNNLGVRGLSSTPFLHGSNFYTITYEVGESGEKHTVQVNCNHTRGITNTENRFQFLNCRQKRVTTCWTLPSTMTSTWTGLGHVKAPLLAPLVMLCSHRSVSSFFPGSKLVLI